MLHKLVISLFLLSYMETRSESVEDINIVRKWSLDTLNNSTSIGYADATTNYHNLALAECNNYVQGASHINCKVTVRSHGFIGDTREKTCSFEHPVEGRTYLFKVYSLTSDKIIITFSEDLSNKALRLTLRIVDTSDCQSISRSIISEDGLNLYFHKFVRNDKTFDLLYASKTCANNFCKYTHDFDGNLVDSHKELKETFHNILKIDRVEYSNVNEDYFIVDKTDKFKADIFFSPIAKITKNHNVVVHNYLYSNNSGVARVCWYPMAYDSKIECLHLEDTIKQTSFKIPQKAKLIAIYNLKETDLLLLMKFINGTTQKDEIIIAIAKSNGFMEEVKRFELDVQGTDSVAISQMNENDFCFSFLSIDESRYPSEMLVNFITKCQTIL